MIFRDPFARSALALDTHEGERTLDPIAIRSIVVPLDGSAIAESALTVAIALAKATGAVVHAVHVFVPLPMGTIVHGLVDYAENVEAQLVEDAKAYITAIKVALPERGVIGYIGADDVDGTADYYLAQYALAPRVIDRSSGHPLVIGNFPHGLPKIPPSGLTVVKDFGDGVLLYSNKDGK